MSKTLEHEPTLDELLDRAGVTREEWKRARVVVEDYWMDYARIKGWGPRDETQGHPERRLFRFPLYPDGEFTIIAPLSEAQWEVLIAVLEAAKPGLIATSFTDTSSERQ